MTNPPICPICGSNMTVIKYFDGYRIVCSAKPYKLRGDPYRTEQAAFESWTEPKKPITPIQKQILELRHNSELTWAGIGDIVHYSKWRCMSIYREALRKFSDTSIRRDIT